MGPGRDMVSSAHRRLAGGSDAVEDARGPFAREVARELTSSLSSLWLRVEVMLAELSSGQSPTDIMGDLSVLSRLAGQMAAIVKGLTCFDPASSLDVTPVDLNAFLAEALSPVIPRLARRGIAVRPNRGRTALPILADAEALRYVVTSLVETVAETSATVDVSVRSGENGDVLLHVGNARGTGAGRAITSRDALKLVLADAIVRNADGTLERHIGNPATTFTVSFRAAGQRSAGPRRTLVP